MHKWSLRNLLHLMCLTNTIIIRVSNIYQLRRSKVDSNLTLTNGYRRKIWKHCWARSREVLQEDDRQVGTKRPSNPSKSDTRQIQIISNRFLQLWNFRRIWVPQNQELPSPKVHRWSKTFFWPRSQTIWWSKIFDAAGQERARELRAKKTTEQSRGLAVAPTTETVN